MARGFKPQTISRDSAIGGMDIPRSLRVDQGTSNVSDGSFIIELLQMVIKGHLQ